MRLAFIASKKVGNAVIRAKAKRLLRALVLENENCLKKGNYIFVAKASIEQRDYKLLQKDFNFAMKKAGFFQ